MGDLERKCLPQLLQLFIPLLAGQRGEELAKAEIYTLIVAKLKAV